MEKFYFLEVIKNMRDSLMKFKKSLNIAKIRFCLILYTLFDVSNIFIM